VVAALLVWVFLPESAEGGGDDDRPPAAIAPAAPSRTPGPVATTTAGPRQRPTTPAGGAGQVTTPGKDDAVVVPTTAAPATAAPTTPAPSATSASPTPSEEPSSAPRTKVLTSKAGRVTAECSGGKAHLLDWAPQDPWKVQKVNAGPAATTTAVFRQRKQRIRMTVTCVGGQPATVNLPL
jgi:eukaryotic-like serine/threonine-protein kinase